jgi:hypothetical protein
LVWSGWSWKEPHVLQRIWVIGWMGMDMDMEIWVYILVAASFFFSAFHSRSFGSGAALSYFSRQEVFCESPIPRY